MQQLSRHFASNTYQSESRARANDCVPVCKPEDAQLAQGAEVWHVECSELGIYC